MTDLPPPEPTTSELYTGNVPAEPVTDTWTVRLVVIFLAVFGVIALAADAALAWLVIDRAYSTKAVDAGVQIDASVALLLGGLLSIATGCMSALGAILASTRGAFTKNR